MTSQRIKQICVDVDGVLADWMGSVFRFFGKEPDTVKEAWQGMLGEMGTEKALGVSRSAMWDRVKAEGQPFWAGLEAFPWAEDLWKHCNKIAPTILLTSCSIDPQCSAGKVRWMYRQPWLKEPQGRKFRQYLIGSKKHFCASPTTVLIDDTEKKIDDFREHGGKAILFPQYWNKLHLIRNREEQMMHIYESLEAIQNGN